MTCIVGLVDGQSVWIGGDSHASAGCQRYPDTPLERKVVRIGGMVIGATGPSRMIQLIEHVLEIPEHPSGIEPYPYLVRFLAPAIRAMIVTQDGVKINDPNDGWELLLGYRGGLYSVCHDLSVSHLPEYGAVGCGREYAMGALHSTGALGPHSLAPDARLRWALEAAVDNDVHVAPPFVIERAE